MQTQKSVAIVGGGIVGLTTAFYLKEAGYQNITIFDDGVGQATKAAAGIISPWLSKRRNKRWYELAKLGASLYKDIVSTANISKHAYRQNGTIVTRENQEKLTQLIELAKTRLLTTPTMKSVKAVSATEIMEMIPGTIIDYNGLYVEGGAQIDGANFLNELLKYLDIEIFNKKVVLTSSGQIENEKDFEKIVLAVGPALDQMVKPLNLKTNVRPQKGQLIVLNKPSYDMNLPVLMPIGEFDYIPLANQGVIIGATHEDDGGFDLTPSEAVVEELVKSGQNINPAIKKENIVEIRVGTRAYTPDYAPFFGALPNFKNIFVASGLGSSGLTTGPAIAKCLANLVMENEVDLDKYTKSIDEYVN